MKDWIRRRLLRATDTPYQCYWRNRAFRAEAELRGLTHARLLLPALRSTLHAPRSTSPQ